MTLKDNTQLEMMMIEPGTKVKGTIQILHGMSEHMERYVAVASYFSERGYRVIMHNQRGHGKQIPDYTRGHFDSVEQLVTDGREIMETYRAGERIILLGHSMGSIVARKYIAMYPDMFTDCILVGTGYYDAKYKASILLLKSLIKVHGANAILPSVNNISTTQFNRKFKPLKTDRDWLSLSEENVQSFIDDEYCGFDVSLSVLLSVAESMQETQQRKIIKSMDAGLNLLFVSGTDDPFSNFGKGIHKLARLYNKGIENVTVQLYHNARHEVLNEVNRTEVLDNIGKWLRRNE